MKKLITARVLTGSIYGPAQPDGFSTSEPKKSDWFYVSRRQVWGEETEPGEIMSLVSDANQLHSRISGGELRNKVEESFVKTLQRLHGNIFKNADLQ